MSCQEQAESGVRDVGGATGGWGRVAERLVCCALENWVIADGETRRWLVWVAYKSVPGVGHGHFSSAYCANADLLHLAHFALYVQS